MGLFHILIVKINCMPEKSVFLLYANMYLNKKQKKNKQKTKQFIAHKLQTIFIGLVRFAGANAGP